MGLGFRVTAPIGPEGFLVKHTPTHQELLDRLQTAIPALLVDERLQAFLWMAVEEETLLVGCHPTAEPLRVFFPTDAVLCCEARTQGAGPGYHAFLVDLLQKVGQKCRLRWQWDGNGEDDTDDTGYAQQKNFAKLQGEMLRWLKAVCANLLEQADDGAKRLRLCMPQNYPYLADETFFLMTALGPRAREWVAKTAAAEGAALQTAGAEFFPWWNRPCDAAFWRNTGLALAWVDLPWHPPVGEQEQALYGLAAFCFEQAAAGSTPVHLHPVATEIAAMQTGDDSTCPPPDPAGVGYRRQVMLHALPGGWTLPLPGCYYTSMEANGERYNFAYGSRAISVTTLSVASRSENASFEEHLLQKLKALHGEAELLKFQRGTLIGRAAIAHGADGGCWSLTGYVAASNNMALLTLTFPGETELDWATGVWQSLTHPEGS
jgi:hypothetical protein